MGKVDCDLVRQAKQATMSVPLDMPAAGMSEVSFTGIERPDDRLSSQIDPRFSREGLLQTAIGRAVHDCRRRHDLNGVDLAKAAGISLGMLSRIENGTVSPSLGTLQALASALGVSLTSFISRYNEASRAVFVAASKEAGMRRKEDPSRDPILREGSSFNAAALEVRLIELHSKGDRPPKLEDTGTYFLHCLSGEVTYRHAKSQYHMAAGDSLLFDAHQAHGIAKITRLPAHLLSIRCYLAVR